MSTGIVSCWQPISSHCPASLSGASPAKLAPLCHKLNVGIREELTTWSVPFIAADERGQSGDKTVGRIPPSASRRGASESAGPGFLSGPPNNGRTSEGVASSRARGTMHIRHRVVFVIPQPADLTVTGLRNRLLTLMQPWYV